MVTGKLVVYRECLQCCHAGTETCCFQWPQDLPKHVLSPASTEGCKPGRDPSNLEAVQSLLYTFCWGIR